MKDLTEELRIKHIGRRDPISDVVNILLRTGFQCTELSTHKGDLLLTVLREKGKSILDSRIVVEIYTDEKKENLELVVVNNNIMTYNFTKYYYDATNYYMGLDAKVLLGPEDVDQLSKILSIIYDSTKFFEYEQRLLELRFELSIMIESTIYPVLKENEYRIYRNRQFGSSRIDLGTVPKVHVKNSCLDYIFTRLDEKKPFIGFGVHPVTGRFIVLDVKESNLQNYHQVDLNELSKEELVEYIKTIISYKSIIK